MPPYIAPEEGMRRGYWGVPTSTLDFCEENYAHTEFIAELWNTVSNAAYIVPALVGLWYCWKYKIETRYLVCHTWLLILGIGSFMFHCTLRHSMQLLDELPMLILAACMLYPLLEMDERGGHPLFEKWKVLRMGVVAGYTVVVILVYLIVNDPTFQEVAYAILVVVIVFFGFKSLGQVAKWRYLGLAILSVSCYALGFFLWNIDNIFCPSIRVYRSTGPLLGGLTHLHAWWHILTGYSTYLHLVIGSKIRMEFLGYRCQFRHLCGVPYVEVQSKKSN